MSTINFKPMNKMLLIEPDKAQEEIGGILLPKRSQNTPPSGRIVVAADDCNNELAGELNVGRRIYFYTDPRTPRAMGLELDGTPYIIAYEDAIIGYEPVYAEESLGRMKSVVQDEVRSPVQPQPN